MKKTLLLLCALSAGVAVLATPPVPVPADAVPGVVEPCAKRSGPPYGRIYITDVAGIADCSVYVTDVAGIADIKVYITKSYGAAQRPGVWYITDVAGAADYKVYFTNSAGAADYKVYFTPSSGEAR